MVPVGEALIPYLIDFTADFTIYLLRQTGLSVYREGTHFSLVSGDWSVVEACSGLRYLLASFTLGTIYAYITYQKLYKRLLFMLFSLILPIIANGLRAYMIVMIGHLSGMKLAVGVDHLIYGAIFFTFIIFIMFYIGSFWRDNEAETTPSSVHNNRFLPTHHPNTYYIALTILLCFAIWPIASHWLKNHYHAKTTLPGWPPLSQNKNWRETAPPNWPWKPVFETAVNDSTNYFKHLKNNSVVGFYQATFGDEQQGAELVSANNVLRRYNPDHQLNERQLWHILMQFDAHSESIPTLPYSIMVLRGSKHPIDFIIIKWYQLGSFHTNNGYLAKLIQLYKRLKLDNTPETNHILFFKIKQTPGINQQQVLLHIRHQTPLSLK
jgi:exosortase/archaeosortase family protein